MLKWAWVLIISGVAAGLTCLIMLKRRRPSPDQLVTTQGVVMKSESWEAITNAGNIPSARVTFNYVVQGRPFTCRQTWANGPEPPPVGSPVTVYYDPKSPHRAIVLPHIESSGGYAMMLLLVILAVHLTGIGLVMLIMSLSNR